MTVTHMPCRCPGAETYDGPPDVLCPHCLGFQFYRPPPRWWRSSLEPGDAVTIAGLVAGVVRKTTFDPRADTGPGYDAIEVEYPHDLRGFARAILAAAEG